MKHIFQVALRSIRTKHHISQEKLAELCGMSRTRICAIESPRHSVTETTVAQLLKGLGVSWAEFGAAVDEVVALSGKTEVVPVVPPKFLITHCSQCGGSFGPGDAGYSHCQDHHSLDSALVAE